MKAEKNDGAAEVERGRMAEGGRENEGETEG